MKYIILISILLWAFAFQLNAQSCDDFDPETFTHTTNVWDWRVDEDENWTAYIKTTLGNPSYVSLALPFPWRSQSNTYPNVAHLNTVTDFDYEPEDGWELIVKHFGGDSQTMATENPTFILYNRFKGIMRVFIWFSSPPGELLNGAAVVVKFEPRVFEKVSSLLGLIESPVHPLDQFNKEIKSVTPNDFSNPVQGEWLFTDIPMLYDPCTCGKSVNQHGELTDNVSELLIYGKLIETMNITEKKDTESDEQVATSAAKGTNMNRYDPVAVVSKGSKFFKSFNGLVDQVEKLQKGNAAKPNSGSGSTAQYEQTKETRTVRKATSNNSGSQMTVMKVPGFFKLLPVIGDVFVAFDALISGGMKSKAASSANTGATAQTKFEGDITMTGNVLGHSIYTPGSPHDNTPNPDPLKQPVYDHVLGIFNLIETPEMEYTSYEYDDNAIGYYCQPPNWNISVPFDFPEIRQYHLKTPLKFVINPASELELVDLSASILYQVGNNSLNETIPISKPIAGSTHALAFYGPVGMKRNASLDYIDRLKLSGVHVETWPRQDLNDPNSPGVNDLRKIVYSTGFFPATCLQKQSILLAFPNSTDIQYHSYLYEPKFFIKVRAILKRKDSEADDDTEAVIFMATFPMKAAENSIAGGLTYSMTNNATPTPSQSCASTNEEFLVDFAVTGFTSTSNPNGPHFPLGSNGLPVDLVIENTTVESDQEALNQIIIRNSTAQRTPSSSFFDPLTGTITIPPGPPITLRAGGNIDIDPGSQSSFISDDVTLEIALPLRFGGCEEEPVPAPASWEEDIRPMCQDQNKYNPVVANRMAGDSLEMRKIPFEAHPVPSNDMVTFSFELEGEDDVQISLFDLTGRKVMTIQQNQVFHTGAHDVQANISSLSTGIYVATLETSTIRQSVRVVRK